MNSLLYEEKKNFFLRAKYRYATGCRFTRVLKVVSVILDVRIVRNNMQIIIIYGEDGEAEH